MSNQIKRSSHCKGCIGCDGKYNRDGFCPCGTCLIKVMCDSECETYVEYSDLLIGDGKTEEEVLDHIKQRMEERNENT